MDEIIINIIKRILSGKLFFQVLNKKSDQKTCIKDLLEVRKVLFESGYSKIFINFSEL